MSVYRESVLEFYARFGEVGRVKLDGPGLSSAQLNEARLRLKMSLIVEELAELADSVYSPSVGDRFRSLWAELCSDGSLADPALDVVGAADATGDLRYVLEGFDIEAGIPSEEVFAEIHASNMSKLGRDGRPIISDGTVKAKGKIMKGPDFFEPDLRSVLFGGAPDRTPVSQRTV